MFFAQASGRFCPGRLVATPMALEEIPANEWQAALCRHLRCDWGAVCERDWNANDDAVQSGERLLSAYTTKTGVKFWFITEADRSATTILLPEEY